MVFVGGRVRSGFAWIALIGLVASFGCATPKAGGGPVQSSVEPYRIAPADHLSIRVLPEPAIEVTDVQVRPDGKISVELIGDVVAAGRTTDEVAGEITERMAEFRQAPSVTVSVASPASTTVSVMGEVRSPGSFPLERDVRVSEAVALAGGQSELAATSRVRIVRREGAGTVLYLADLDRIKAGDGSTDLQLRRGDLVVVPAAYPVVAGYEVRKALYPFEALFRVIGSSFFLVTAFLHP